jgi:hypothetical protein
MVKIGHVKHCAQWPQHCLLRVFRTENSILTHESDSGLWSIAHKCESFSNPYCYSSRTHLSLCKDAPEPRAKQPPECGSVSEIVEVVGLHHRYERRAA